MKKRFLWAFMVLPALASAQMPPPFHLLDQSEITTEIFLPLTGLEGLRVPDGVDETALDYSTTQQVFMMFHKAAFDTALVPSPITTRRSAATIKSQQLAIPIRVLDLEYTTFQDHALEEGLIALVDSAVVDQTNALENPYINRRACAFYVDRSTYVEGSYIFKLTQEGYFTNLGTAATFEVDFDDGLGFRDIAFGQSYEVSYEDQNSDRTMLFRVQRGTDVRTMRFVLKSAGGNDMALTPVLPPWPSEVAAYPWRVSEQTENGIFTANAYTAISEDGIFDKPFVFIEGIDFGLEFDPYRFGDFGWYEFSCGNSPKYPFLEKMPELLLPLSEAGYDIILIDFKDGAASLWDNVRVVQKIIHLINEHKVGTIENVISGASMGAVLARMAITDMELNGENHCTRSWISLDGPHRGANVPMGLQTTIETLATQSYDAAVFKILYLLRPATRELLISQLPSSGSKHTQFQSQLDEMGYPHLARGLGIANGSQTGTMLPFFVGDPIMYYDCSVGPFDLLNLRINAAPGDPADVLGPNNHWVVSRVKRIQTSFLNTGTAAITYALDPNQYPGIDNAPGGMRNSMVELATSLNKFIDDLGFFEDLFDICPNDVSQYEPYHSFIPTGSALGLDVTTYYAPALPIIEDNPHLLPFDAYYAPLGYNMTHSELNDDIIAFVLDETFAGEPIMGNEITASVANGYFNYGKPQQYIVGDALVHDGGVLYINGTGPLHYGETSEFAASQSTYYARTSSCGSTLEIGNAGSLIIGETENGRVGELEVTNGSTLKLVDGGFLHIRNGSVLRIAAGGQMIIDAGEMLVEEGGQLIVEAGGVLEYASESAIVLIGAESAINLHGELHIADETTCTIECGGSDGGKLRCYNSGQSVIGSPSSELYIYGTGMNDRIVEVMQGGALWTSPSFGRLTLKNGKVTLAQGAKLTSTGKLRADKVLFEGSDPGSTSIYGLRMWNSSNLTKCRFVNMKLFMNPWSHLVSMTDCDLLETKVQAYSGGFRATNCVFTESNVDLNDMYYATRMVNCDFATEGNLEMALADNSNVMLYTKNCTFNGYHTGIEKNGGGELRMRCSTISNCSTGARIMDFSTANLSSNFGAGYNAFHSNEIHLHLINAADLRLMNGHNTFGAAFEMLIYGSLIGSCDNDCSFLLNANNNYWGQYIAPIPSAYYLTVTDNACPNSGCTATLSDKFIDFTSSTCGLYDTMRPAVKPKTRFADGKTTYDFEFRVEEGDFLVLSGNFEGWPLEDALIACRQVSSEYGGSDMEALEMYQELFSSDMNARSPEIMALTVAGINDAMNCLENVLFVNDELNDAAIEMMTNVLNKSAMAEFDMPYLGIMVHMEEIKARLARLARQTQIGQDIRENAVWCGMDSLGTTFMAGRYAQDERQMMNQELSIAYPDSLKDSAIVVPEWSPQIDQEIFHFGAIFNGIDDIDYPICSDTYKAMAVSMLASGDLYPNPAENSLFIDLHERSSLALIVHVYDAFGREVDCGNINWMDANKRLTISVEGLPPGWYALRLSNEFERHLFPFIKE